MRSDARILFVTLSHRINHECRLIIIIPTFDWLRCYVAGAIRADVALQLLR